MMYPFYWHSDSSVPGSDTASIRRQHQNPISPACRHNDNPQGIAYSEIPQSRTSQYERSYGLQKRSQQPHEEAGILCGLRLDLPPTAPLSQGSSYAEQIGMVDHSQIHVSPIVEPDSRVPCSRLSPPDPISVPSYPFLPASFNDFSSYPYDSPPTSAEPSDQNDFRKAQWPHKSEQANPKVPQSIPNYDHFEVKQAATDQSICIPERPFEEMHLEILNSLREIKDDIDVVKTYTRKLFQDFQSLLDNTIGSKLSEQGAFMSDGHRTHINTSGSVKQGNYYCDERIPDHMTVYGTPPPRGLVPDDNAGEERCYIGRPVGKILRTSEEKKSHTCSKHKNLKSITENLSFCKNLGAHMNPWTCQ
jgi:hypothetical protein